MTDFKAKIQAHTCISEEYKAGLLKMADLLPEAEQSKILATLEKGQAEIDGLEKERDEKVRESIKAEIEEIKEFKRGPLREAYKKAEGLDHSADEAAAEDLLKDL